MPFAQSKLRGGLVITRPTPPRKAPDTVVRKPKKNKNKKKDQGAGPRQAPQPAWSKPHWRPQQPVAPWARSDPEEAAAANAHQRQEYESQGWGYEEEEEEWDNPDLREWIEEAAEEGPTAYMGMGPPEYSDLGKGSPSGGGSPERTMPPATKGKGRGKGAFKGAGRGSGSAAAGASGWAGGKGPWPPLSARDAAMDAMIPGLQRLLAAFESGQLGPGLGPADPGGLARDEARWAAQERDARAGDAGGAAGAARTGSRSPRRGADV